MTDDVKRALRWFEHESIASALMNPEVTTRHGDVLAAEVRRLQTESAELRQDVVTALREIVRLQVALADAALRDGERQ